MLRYSRDGDVRVLLLTFNAFAASVADPMSTSSQHPLLPEGYPQYSFYGLFFPQWVFGIGGRKKTLAFTPLAPYDLSPHTLTAAPVMPTYK